MIWSVLDSTCQQGLLYAIAVFGIVISFRIMNFPDLTVDGSFTLGGAVAAILLVNECPPILATMASALAGFIAGSATVFLNRKLGISKVLSGILVMLMLYSVNLRIMGRANVSLLRIRTLFSYMDDHGPLDPIRLMVYLSICALSFLILCYLFTSRIGLFIRATGDNEFMVQSHGTNTNWLYLSGIGLANMFVALCGGLVAQHQGFADVNMGVGMIITVLAALIVGESAYSALRMINWKALHPFRNRDNPTRDSNRRLPWDLYATFFSAAFGALFYFLIISICLRAGLAPTDLRLATGILVVLGISLRLKGPMVETHMRGKL